MTQARVFSCLLAFVALSFTVFAVQSGDVMMYLALARDFIFSGKWSQSADPYLYSLPNAQLVWTHEYLSYLLFANFHSMLGVPGLILLKSLVWGAVFTLALIHKPTERNLSWLWIALWLLAVLAGSFRFIERSSMFSDFLCVWMVYYLIEKNTVDRRMVFILSGVFFLWAQLHPGFAMGILLLGTWAGYHVFLSRKLPAKQTVWLLFPIAIIAINPEGISGLTYPFEFALHEASTFKKYNFEWMPSYGPLFRFAPETIAFWLLCLGSLVVIKRADGWFSIRGIFALFCMAVATQTVRFIPWASFAILICIKPWTQLNFVLANPKRWQNIVLGTFIALLGIKNLLYGYKASSGERLPQWTLDPKFFPVKTEEFLRERRIQGNLYNTHDFGSYLAWQRQLPIFHHGFVTDMKFYENEVIGVFQSQQRFLELAAKHNWTMLLIEKHGAYRYFYQILAPLPQWKIVAEDESSYLIYHLPN